MLFSARCGNLFTIRRRVMTMNRVVLDADLRAKLKSGTAKVTLTDESGKQV